jgi:heme oxygenase
MQPAAQNPDAPKISGKPPPAPLPAYPLTTSERLKRDFADTHAALEQLMQLPHAIKTVQNYAATLKIFFSVFAPLEDALALHQQWPQLGIDFAQHRRTQALQSDIFALTGAACAAPPPAAPFASFSQAFGALYVLEGSALGGRFILRDLQARLGPAIAGATKFFAGHGAQTGPFWNALKQKLDTYGARHPDQYPCLAAGARQAFDRFMQAAKPAAE